MSDGSAESGASPKDKIDTTVPHSARIWNYFLGGKDNYAVDRAAGDQFIATFPDIAVIARANREFMGRAIRYLVGEEGIRQFLDIGTGLPTFNSTHEVAQHMAPESRIVYVDNDPVVLRHAVALLKGDPRGVTDYLDADMRQPEAIIAGAVNTLDFTRPIAVMFLGVLGHVTDDDEAQSIVRRLMDSAPSGSFLVLSDGAAVMHSPEADEALEDYNATGAEPYTLRTPAQLASFFAGLDLVEPGLVSVTRWRPAAGLVGSAQPAEIDHLGGVGRKP